MVRLVDSRVRVQPRVDHDPIDEVVDDDGDGVDASQPLVQRRFRSCAVGHAEHRRPVGAACTLDTVCLSDAAEVVALDVFEAAPRRPASRSRWRW